MYILNKKELRELVQLLIDRKRILAYYIYKLHTKNIYRKYK